MKVHELIAKLQKADPQLDVFCYTEDEALLAKGHFFRLLDIEHIQLREGELRRADDEIPTLKIGKHANSKELVMLGVTCTF